MSAASAPARAADPPDDDEEAPAPAPYCITELDIEGLSRTKPHVVKRELAFDGIKKGALADNAQIEEGVQRLRNLGIFRQVLVGVAEDEPSADCGEHQPVHIRIRIDEQWTTLPLFNYSRGGGTYQLILGAHDINFLGRYLDVGAQYERLGDTNSFFGWAADPRLFNERLLAGMSIGRRNQLYNLYEADGTVGGGFLLERFSVEAYLQREWLWWLRTGLNLHFDDDDYSLKLLSDAIRDKQRARGLPQPTHALTFGVNALVGRLDRDSYRVDGILFMLLLEHANAGLGSSYTYSDLVAGLTYFKTLPFNSTLGLRASGAFAATDRDNYNMIQRRYYIGGLTAIRGFPYDRFSGNHYWLSNVEFRVPSVDTRWFVLQHILFADAAGVAEEFSGLGRVSGASAGLGLRIVVPKIQGLVVRIDYAWAIHGDTTNPLSLGGGQFF